MTAFNYEQDLKVAGVISLRSQYYNVHSCRKIYLEPFVSRVIVIMNFGILYVIYMHRDIFFPQV
jgi:hypothetical protein